MFRFERPEFLYGMLMVLPIIALFIHYISWNRKAILSLGDPALISRLTPGRSKSKPYLKFALLIPAILLLALGLANPQYGSKTEKVKRTGVDLIVALDVSRSMLAQDLKPDRLEMSKQFITRLISSLKGDRIGLIIFAGNAYIQMPLTIDYAAAKMFLANINTELVPSQGTAIADAISLAIQATTSEEKRNSALVIITDGEDHEGEIDNELEEAKDAGLFVHTIGVGDPLGAPIPVKVNGTIGDFVRDKEGSIVLSKMNEAMLQQIAASGKGSYQRLGSLSENVNNILSEIEKMEKNKIDEKVVTDYEDHFYYFLLGALFFVSFEFFIDLRKSLWVRKMNNWFSHV